MEFRDVKPPMPTLRLPEDYVYNPLYFVSDTPANGKLSARDTAVAPSPASNGHDASHASLPSSTYLHRPLRFVSPSPHGTPLRRRDQPAKVQALPTPVTPLSTPPAASQHHDRRRTSSGHSGNTSLIRRAHALAQEVAEWQRFQATLANEHEASAGAFSASGTDPDGSQHHHRLTRAAQLRAHHTHEVLEDREEAAQDIFYRPKKRTSSAGSLRSPRRPPGALQASALQSDCATPHRRLTTTSVPTPRSTRAAELRQRHSVLLLEEMEEEQRLREEEEKEGAEAQAAHQLRSARSHTSPRGPTVGAVQLSNEERHRRTMKRGGQNGGSLRAAAATPTRRRSSLASISSKDDMNAAVSKYLDEQERRSEEQVHAVSDHKKAGTNEGKGNFDAPAPLPAPKQPRRRRSDVGQPQPQPPTASSQRSGKGTHGGAYVKRTLSSPQRTSRAVDVDAPLSPEPRPPPSHVSVAAAPAARHHARVPSTASTTTTARPLQSPLSHLSDNAPQRRKPVKADLRNGEGAAVTQVPFSSRPPAQKEAEKAMTASVQGLTELEVPPSPHTLDAQPHTRASSRAKSSASSSCSSIEFDIATLSRAHSTVVTSADDPSAGKDTGENSLHADSVKRQSSQRQVSVPAVFPAVTTGARSTAPEASQGGPLSLDRNDAEDSLSATRSAQRSISLASHQSFSAAAAAAATAPDNSPAKLPRDSSTVALDPAPSTPSKMQPTSQTAVSPRCASIPSADSAARTLLRRQDAQSPAMASNGERGTTDVKTACGIADGLCKGQAESDAAEEAAAERKMRENSAVSASLQGQRPRRTFPVQRRDDKEIVISKDFPRKDDLRPALSTMHTAVTLQPDKQSECVSKVAKTEEDPVDVTVLSQSFVSLHSFHSDDDDEGLLQSAENPVHSLPASLVVLTATSPSTDAATTQAELLRYYRSANSSSVGPVRYAAPLCPTAALPMRVTPGDDVGNTFSDEVQPHTAVEDIVCADTAPLREAEEEVVTLTSPPFNSCKRTATTTTRSSSRDSARSSVSTASTSSENSDSEGCKEQALCQRYFTASLTSLPSEGKEEEALQRNQAHSEASSAFLVNAAQDFSFLRGRVVPFIPSGSDTTRSTPVYGPFSGSGLRAWGLPVPPTNHTHAAAAWEARQRAEAAATSEENAVVGLSADPFPLHRKGGAASSAESPLPPYEPRMEGPVWKDALDTVRLPHLQESNRSIPTLTPAVSQMGGDEKSNSTLLVMDKPQPTPFEKEERATRSVTAIPASKEREEEEGKREVITPSAVSVSGIPSSLSHRSLEPSLANASHPTRTSRLPARTRATPPVHPPATQKTTRPLPEGQVPPTDMPAAPSPVRTALPQWTQERPYSVGATGQRQGSPSHFCDERPSVRLPRRVLPVSAAPETAEAREEKHNHPETTSTTCVVDFPSNSAMGLESRLVPTAVASSSHTNESPDRSAAPPSTSSSPAPPSAIPVTSAQDQQPKKEHVEQNGKAAEEKTPSASFSSASSLPFNSDGGPKQLSKYAQWKARQEAARRAVEMPTTQLSLPSNSNAVHRDDEEEKGVPSERTPDQAECVMEDLANVHVAVTTTAPSAVLDGTSALASTTHTVLGSYSLGGTEAERTPLERSMAGMHSDDSENGREGVEGGKAPLSHAPTPLQLQSPPPNAAVQARRRSTAVHGVDASVPPPPAPLVLFPLASSEPSSRAFSRSDASTRSLSASAAGHAMEREGSAGGSFTPVQWMERTAEDRLPELMCVAEKPMEDAPMGNDGETCPPAACVGDSPPATADVTIAQEALQFSSSGETHTLTPPPPPPPAHSPASAHGGDDGGSEDERRSELSSERGQNVSTPHALFSRYSSSFASTPFQHSVSLSTSLARMDGGTASAPLVRSGEKKGREVQEEEEWDVGGDEEVGSGVGHPQEPVRQRDVVPHGTPSDAPHMSVPPRTSCATTTEDEGVLSPYRPATPVPGSALQTAPSLPSDHNPWSGCSSPVRQWEGFSPASTQLSVAEEGLEVFRGATRATQEAPLTRVQYVHQDL